MESIDLFDAQSSTGLWATESGTLRAPLAPSGTAGKEFLAGTGADGAFLNGPTQSGIQVAGSVITINTDTKSVFQFSRFTLTNSYSIQVTGSNPLIIKSVGPVTIAGSITLDGNNGANNASSGITLGGAGTASGGAGGNGGSAAGTQPTNGSPFGGSAATSPNGGTAYTNSATYGSPTAGDGGCNGRDGGGNDAVQTSTRCSGSNYTVTATAFETLFTGGAGGAGGSAYTAAAAADKVSGAAGGGGGGALQLVSAGSVQITGNILARGGAGGSNSVGDNATGTECAGSGGGGSGGSLWIQTLTQPSITGTLNVSGGVGGTTTGSCAGNGNDHNGGKGSRGLVRLDSVTNPAPTTQPAGSVTFYTASLVANQSYSILSKAIDLTLIDTDYAEIDLSEVIMSTGCDTTGTLPVLSFQGSQDGSTNWSRAVTSSEIASLNGYRYLRFTGQISVNASSQSMCISGIKLKYEPRVISNFLLKGGLACASVTPNSKNQKQKRDSELDFGLFTLIFCLFGAAKSLMRPKKL